MKGSPAVITILPHKRQIRTPKGGTLLEALIHHSIFLRTDCGGKGTCGKCRVEVIQPDQSVTPVSSCRFEVERDVCIRIPESSMLSSHIMSKAKIFFPDGYPRRVSGQAAFGVAVDLGTTTIAVYLCNLGTGKVISSLAVKNPQALYGDDVMSRIGVIGQDGGNLKKLQAMVIKSIEWGMAQLASRQKETPVAIDKVVVVGNPAMIHILAGVDPQPIGVAPYLPVFHEARAYDARDLGFHSIDCSINLLPQISGFIGGDILAAAMAVDLENLKPGTLLVDLGTNGELILKGKDTFYATSCATGPAFEGASLSCGMQAIPGAINRVAIDTNTLKVSVTTIRGEGGEDVPAAGICGAGVLNAVARMCDHGIIEPDGRFAKGEKEFVLVGEEPETDRSAVYISQKDIRSVQLGKSALMTGIEFLCENAGFDLPKAILIAGAFGSHQDKKDLVRLGILPEIGDQHILTMGNAAGSGAVMALCDDSYLDDAKRMAGNIEVVNLATNIKFQERFIENLNFPE